MTYNKETCFMMPALAGFAQHLSHVYIKGAKAKIKRDIPPQISALLHLVYK